MAEALVAESAPTYVLYTKQWDVLEDLASFSRHRIVCLSVCLCLYVYIFKTSPLSPQWSRVMWTRILFRSVLAADRRSRTIKQKITRARSPLI